MAKIAACLIVKNSAETIKACLDSIRPFVDEINLYDTGSTDDTLEVLRKLDETRFLVTREGLVIGTADADQTLLEMSDELTEDRRDLSFAPLAPIRVEKGEWTENFAEARAKSWEMAGDDVDWLLWLDDDDIVEGANQLRMLAHTAPPELDGFVFVYDYARDERGNCVCELWRERLMRRSAGYVWKGEVHEVLVPPDGKIPALAPLPREQVRYIHNRPADRYEPDRNLKILLREKEHAEHEGRLVEPRTLAYLGTELMAKGQFTDALGYFHAYLQREDAGWSDERMQVTHKLAICLRMTGNPMGAVEVEFQALRERDDWGETSVGLCESFAALNQWNRVEVWAKRALALGQPHSMLILNPLEFTFVPMVRLSEACLHQGRHDEALQWLQQANAVAPSHPVIVERQQAYEYAKYDADLVNAALTLREAAVRYDENLKALEIIENVPYRIQDNPAIVKARADQREMCKHYLRPEEYLRWYTDEPKESTLLDEHIDLVGTAFGRVGGLLAGLQEQEKELGRKPRLLDLGCNDFWMGEFFWRQGFHTDGVELNRRSYEIALERKERFGRDDAVIVHGDLHDAQRLLGVGRHIAQGDNSAAWTDGQPLYDAVSLFEVLEHVPDVEHTLSILESLVKPGGRVYISTPDGAFENGNLPNWAKVERKGHLRALPMDELAELLNKRGSVEQLVHTDGDRVAFASYIPTPKKGKVVFYAGGGWEQWSPTSIHTTGLGGSESALVQVAVQFARAGYEVTVYSGAEPGLYAGVLFRPFTAWDPTAESDLLIVSRMPHVFDNPLGATHTVLWCHDHSYPGVMTEERAASMNTVVVLSDWEKDRYERLYPYLAGKLVVIRNGITLDDRYADADRSFKQRHARCIYSSSADRGLDVMLDAWPEIREHVPHAELHVFYGFDVFDRVAVTQPHLLAYKAQLLNKVTELGGEDAGIHLRGRIGQRALAGEMQEARVWSYPTAFLETSCIGAMEARAAGLPIVTSNLGALQESVGSHGQLLNWAVNDDGVAEDEPHNRSPEYRSWFVREVVRLLKDEQHWNAWHRRALAGVDELTWDQRLPEWEGLLAEVAEAVAA